MSTRPALSFSMSSTVVARYVGRERTETTAPITRVIPTQTLISRRRLTTTAQWSAKWTSGCDTGDVESIPFDVFSTTIHTLTSEKRFRHNDDVIRLERRIRFFAGDDGLVIHPRLRVLPV